MNTTNWELLKLLPKCLKNKMLILKAAWCNKGKSQGKKYLL